MGTKGSAGKGRSIRFPKWMYDTIQELADKGGFTFTEVVLDLLRQELKVMGYTMGIGREGVDNAAVPVPFIEAKKGNQVQSKEQATG